MKLLLVSTYELGHQPLHVASPLARLQAEGHDVSCLDLSVEEWDQERFDRAEAVAFSVPMHTAMRLAVAAARRLQVQGLSIPIAFYGLYAAMGHDPRSGAVAHHLIVGEYEDRLAAWANDPWAAADQVEVDLRPQRFLVPERSLLPRLDRYAMLEIDGERRLAGYVEASHGCRHKCRHCPIPAVYDGRYRVTGLETVLEDIGQLVAMGARHITFGDPDFLNAPRYSLDVIRAVNDAFPFLTFDLTVKVEHILEHRGLWPELGKRNVLFVVSAFETVNDRVLRILDKGHNAADMAEAVQVMRGAGLSVRPSWLPFTPWSTRDDIEGIFRFLATYDLLSTVDAVQLGIRLLLPAGSLLLSAPEMSGLLGDYDEEALTYSWRSEQAEMDSLQRALTAIAESQAGNPGEALSRMWHHAMDGVPMPPLDSAIRPRLTEVWFCCAEPTALQLGAVALG